MLLKIKKYSIFAFPFVFAHANTESVSTGTALELKNDKVEVVGSNRYDERKESSVSKIVVNHDDIIRFGDNTIADVLKRLPGITIISTQGRGNEIRMRGLGSGYTQILLNGEQVPPGFSIDTISPELIERIEIYRAANAEFSSQAIAGTINVILKKVVKNSQSELKTSLFSENEHISSGLNTLFSRRYDHLSYTLAGMLIHAPYSSPYEVEDAGGTSQDFQNLLRKTSIHEQGNVDTLSISPRINWGSESGDAITSQSFVKYRRSLSNDNQDTSTLIGDPPQYAHVGREVYSMTSTIRSDVEWMHRLKDDGKLKVKFGYAYNKRELDVHYSQLDNEYIYILDRQVLSNAVDRSLTLSGKYSVEFAKGHILALGWDSEYSERNEERLQGDITNANLGILSLPRQYFNIDEAYEARVRRLALFLQDEWTIAPSLSAYMGLRWEGLSVLSKGNTFSEASSHSGVWSPLIQSVWKLPEKKNDQVRLSLTRTYKAPAIADLMPRRYVAINNSQTSPDTQGNPGLRPELAWGLDLAYEKYIGDGSLFSTAIFSRRIEDVTLHRLSQNNGIWISSPINDGRADTYGLELDWKLHSRDFNVKAPNIDLRFNFTRTWSRVYNVPGPDNRLDQQIPISANLGVDYHADKIPLAMGVSFSYQDGGSVRLSTLQSTYSIPKRTMDFYALWKFDKSTQLRLAFANILHQNNVSSVSYFDKTLDLHQTTTNPTNLIVKAILEKKF